MELLHLQKYIYYYQSEFSRLTTILRYMDLYLDMYVCLTFKREYQYFVTVLFWIRHFIIYLSSSLSREYSQIAFEKRKTLKKVSFSSFYFLLKVVIVLKTAYHQQCNRNGSKMKFPNEFELEGCRSAQ